jgi:membrane protein
VLGTFPIVALLFRLVSFIEDNYFTGRGLNYMFRNFWFLLKESFHEWSEDKASRLAAALSYFTIFSLAPLLVIVIAVAGFVWGRSSAQGAIMVQVQGLVGQQGAQQVQTMIQNANHPGAGIIATIISIVELIIGATGVFNALQDSMNTIWEVKVKPSGIWTMIRERFLSFAMVLGIGFLLIVSLIVTAALSALGKFMAGALPFSTLAMQGINILVSLLVMTFLFAVIYKFLPDVKIRWRDVLLGGLVTAILFTIGRQIIGLYLGRSTTASVFGAAGSLIVLLIWVYYSGQILFFGAEFTQVYANHFGMGIEPAKNAEWVTEEERAKMGIPHTRPQSIQKTGQQPGSQSQPQVLPQGQPRTAVPALSAVPVTGQRENKAIDWMNVAGPMIVALLVGVSGSLAIAREQRNRPIVRKTDRKRK